VPGVNTTDFNNTFTGINVPSVWTVDHETNGPYDTCLICSRIVTYLGVLPVPVAGPPGTPPKLIQFHAPFQLRLVAWIVTRWGAAPQLPHWDTGNPAEVLIHHDISAGGPVITQFAQSWQKATGLYVYCLTDPINPTVDGVPVGTNLASVVPTNTFNLQGAQFIRGVIAPAPTGTLGSTGGGG
jgi:hypothetical protein